MTFRQSVPAFLGGISQQSKAIRPTNLVDDSVNMEYLPTEGATKRFPTEHISSYSTTQDPAKTQLVAMSRDDADFLVAVDDTAVKVFNADGTIESVTVASGAFDYLSGATHDSFRFQQVADTLYVANVDVTVLGAAGVDYAPWRTESSAGFFARQTYYEHTYEVVTPLGTATVTTPAAANYTGRAYNTGSQNSSSNAQAIRLSAGMAAGTEPILLAGVGDLDYPGDMKVEVGANDITDLVVRHINDSYHLVSTGTPDGASAYLTYTALPLSGFAPTSSKTQFAAQAANSPGLTEITVAAYDRDFQAIWLTPDPVLVEGQFIIVGNTGSKGNLMRVSPTFVARRMGEALVGLGATVEPAYMTEPTDTDTVEASSFYFDTGESPPVPEYSITVGHGSSGHSASTDEEEIFVWTEDVEELTDLPTYYKQGGIVKITGDSVSTDDDYYLQFATNAWREQTGNDENQFFTYNNGVEDDLFGEGTWRETSAPGLSTGGLDSSTMPHRLQRDSNGDWSFQPVGWGLRPAGDNASNPEPSFVGGRILDIFYHEDRLGFTSDANVIMSESGEIENFWRTTVLSVPDSDPIDVTLAALGGSAVYHAVPFDRKLFAFSETAQAAIDGSGGPLSPATISAKVTGRYRTSPAISPVAQGNSLFAPYATGDSMQIRELVPGQYEGDLQAVETTLAVPRLLPSTTRKVMASSGGNDLVCLTEDGQLFLYQHLRAGNQSLMSAWGRWDFPGGTVVDAATLGDSVYLLINREGASQTYSCLERVSIGGGRGDIGNNFKVRSDRLVSVATGTYDLATDTTIFDAGFPFLAEDALQVTADDGGAVERGAPLTLVAQYPLTGLVEVAGDHSAQPVFIGVQYDSSITMTRPVVQAPSQQGGNTSVIGGRTLVRDFTVTLTDTGYLLATVEAVGQDTTTEEFLADRMDVGELTPSALGSREFSVPIHASSDEFRLTLSNDTAMPSTLVNGAWAIRFNARYRQS